METVCFMQDFDSRPSKLKDRLNRFLANGRPVEYYAHHIKNLAIIGGSLEHAEIDRLLAICTGLENLVLLRSARGVGFFENPQAGRNLRRLSIRMEDFSQYFGTSRDNFYHPCFANITHLHLDDEHWYTYTGWETLTSLTHIAFAYSGSPENIARLMQIVPTVQYVAFGYYGGGGGDEWSRYADGAMVDGRPHFSALWGVKVVRLSMIPQQDWEHGARGGGDFWNVVEREVKRRLEQG